MEESFMKTFDNVYTSIYSKKLAGFLLLKGFELEKFQKSHEDKKRTIFFFQTSPELMKAMAEYDRLNKRRDTAC